MASNPFKEFKGTAIDRAALTRYPFKTLNRILEDIRWSLVYNQSLLNKKPIEYGDSLAIVAREAQQRGDVWYLSSLNNLIDHARSTESIPLPDRNQNLKIIRGLLTSNKRICHYRLIYLEPLTNPFLSAIDKHQFHLIPKNLISTQDLLSLASNDEFILDDAYFMSALNNALLRVSIFTQHFADDDLRNILDKDVLNQRQKYTASPEDLRKWANLEFDSEETTASDAVKEDEKEESVDDSTDSDGFITIDRSEKRDGKRKNAKDLSEESVKITKTETESKSELRAISIELTPAMVIKKFILVLKGPILLDSTEIKTINLENSNLDKFVDLKILFSELHFTLDPTFLAIVSPDFLIYTLLKEEFKRRILELIYIGKEYCPEADFANYSFSNNASAIFNSIFEVDKNNSQLNFNSSFDQLNFFTNLSAFPYFQDELIIKCFEATVESDPLNKLFYVDSIRHVLNYTQTQKLATYLRNQNSLGELIGYLEYCNAMSSMGIKYVDINEVDDESMVAVYQNMIKSDSKNYSYFRNQLTIIAKARRSEKLINFLDTEIVPLELALEGIGIEEITEDEVVITAYEFRLDETLQSQGLNPISDEVKFLHRALLSVAVNRKSYLLLDYIETKLPNIISIPNINTEYAYSLVDSDSAESDFNLITKFEKKLTDTHGDTDIRCLRYSLKLIAESRKSEILSRFLRTGKLDPTLLPADLWPAGLDNIGNTCYLNSLLQYYFCIKPLRELILTFDERDVNLIDLNQDRKIGGRRVENSEIIRSNQFIYHLRYLFHEMIYTKKRCVQPTKELAYMAFLPLSQQVSFKDSSKKDMGVIEIADEDVEIHDEHNPIVVDSPLGDGDLMDVEVSDIHSEYIAALAEDLKDKEMVEEDKIMSPDVEIVEEDGRPKLLPISSDQIDSTIEVGRQQDVTECIENVTYQIETALEPERVDDDGEQYDLIKKLFYGKIKQTLTPTNKNGSKSRISFERFFSLIINVSDNPRDIYDSLDNYFSEDLVNLDGGECKKSLTITELPDVLQFHVQRVMFDRERLMAYKSLQVIPFSETIYLDRYLETDDKEILTKRNQIFKWKSEILQLNDLKTQILNVDTDSKMNIIESLTSTKNFLETKILNDDDLKIQESTTHAIRKEIESLKARLEFIDSRLFELHELVGNQFTNYKKVGYSIFAIFIHRGEASYGHYWVYIKDPHNKVFRKYNDEVVTEVPYSEIFDFTEGNTATPYYIVYVKEDLEQDYIDPLKRILDPSNEHEIGINT